MKKLQQDLYDRGLMDKPSLDLIEAVDSKQLFSVFFELRVVMYLGIMLFTGGLGLLVYNSGNDIFHLLLMGFIVLAMGGCLYFLFKHQQAYTNGEVNQTHALLDYVVLLLALLLVSLFSYIMVYFDLVEILIRFSSWVSALAFLFLAYRYDNKAVLALGITALSAGFGLTVSPVNWVNGFEIDDTALYFISLSLGVLLLFFGFISKRYGVKGHFLFTYSNFGFLLFYFGGLACLFNEILLVGTALFFVASAFIFLTWTKRMFLFFIYAIVVAYICFTYFLVTTIHLDVLIVYYFPISFVAIVVLVVKNKSHFAHE